MARQGQLLERGLCPGRVVGFCGVSGFAGLRRIAKPCHQALLALGCGLQGLVGFGQGFSGSPRSFRQGRQGLVVNANFQRSFQQGHSPMLVQQVICKTRRHSKRRGKALKIMLGPKTQNFLCGKTRGQLVVISSFGNKDWKLSPNTGRNQVLPWVFFLQFWAPGPKTPF